jgi:hypothetical protein
MTELYRAAPTDWRAGEQAELLSWPKRHVNVILTFID